MRWYEPTDEQTAIWREWLAGRPESVRGVAERFRPWMLYRLTTTGQRCSVIAFAEDGTIRIQAEHPALGEISAVEVFGIDPETLVPWTYADEPKHAPMTPSIFDAGEAS